MNTSFPKNKINKNKTNKQTKIKKIYNNSNNNNQNQTGVINGGVTPKDKTKAMPSHLTGKKKKNKNDKQPYWTGVIGGVVTPKAKAAEAKSLCQHDFKKEFVRLPYKTKYKMYCFQVLP